MRIGVSAWCFRLVFPLLIVFLTNCRLCAQSAEITDDSLLCNPPTPGQKSLSWSATFADIPYWDFTWNEYGVVGCYAPVYANSVMTWSPSTYYSPGRGVTDSNPPTENPGFTDGSETDYVPMIGPDGTEEDPALLLGVYVWFEYGCWVEFDGYWYWWCECQLCAWHWVPNPGGACFAAGTLVQTPKGPQPIETLKEGDTVLAIPRDNSDSAPSERRVGNLQKSREEILNLVVGGRTLMTTRSHPFFVRNRGWAPAGTLAVGDVLRTESDEWIVIDSISRGSELPVFNIVIDHKSAYFVTQKGLEFSLCVADSCQIAGSPQNVLPVRSNQIADKATE